MIFTQFFFLIRWLLVARIPWVVPWVVWVASVHGLAASRRCRYLLVVDCKPLTLTICHEGRLLGRAAYLS